MPACSTGPRQKPAVVVAAGGAEAARLAGRKGDGLIVTEPRPELIEAFHSAGGTGPRYAEVAMCYAPRGGGAERPRTIISAGRSTGWPVQAELPDTDGFAAATKHVTPEVVAQSVAAGRRRSAISRPSTATSTPATTTSS